MFNHSAQNNATFWRHVAYLPNLSIDKGESISEKSISKNQCLATVYHSLIEVSNKVEVNLPLKEESCGQRFGFASIFKLSEIALK